MKKILIPTDFSENAWNATMYAIELFKKEVCHFFLLNAYTPAIVSSRFMTGSLNGNQIVDAKRNSEKGLKDVLNRIEKTSSCQGHSFETISSFSLLVDEIRNVVECEGINMIVTGTKGASSLEGIFMGTNTVRIIKSVKNCPVLAIPKNFEFRTPLEIAFATDLNRFYSQSELQPIIDLSITFGAKIRIVHVQNKIKNLTELQLFNLVILRKYLKNVEHQLHTVSELNSVSRTLEVFTDELDIYLLAMLNYKHSYLEKMMRTPVIKHIAFHTQIPLLVIPELGMDGSSKNRKGEEAVVSE